MLIVFYSMPSFILSVVFLKVNLANWSFPFFHRRERDNIDAERAHHMKQIHDLQEHIQEKDRQLLELQEQVCSQFVD